MLIDRVVHGGHMNSSMNSSSVKNSLLSSHGQAATSMHPQSIQNYEYELGKYSTFEDTPKNLLVMGDKDSGVLALFHQEHYISTKR